MSEPNSESNSPTNPSLGWRIASMAVMGSVGIASRSFLYGLNNCEVTGLNNLLGVLDRRKQQGRERGLLTVCNHVAVVDDPLIWGILPLKYAFDPPNLRWGLGAHDICFKNKALSTFFSLGQVLPTHRLWHSVKGGLYQPTMDEAIALLSDPKPTPHPLEFSTGDGVSYPAPAAYASNRHAWLHVFPEACCHQSPNATLRYFKWGVSRLILESDPAPEFIPMFVHGTQEIMSEERGFPRFLPRIRKNVRVLIGEPTDVDKVFGDYRERWRRLVQKQQPDDLMYGQEAVALRTEVAKAVRDEISKLREQMGFPQEEDETAALADTWTKEPNVRKFKSPVDGSLVNRH